jgi:hypothetical protein
VGLCGGCGGGGGGGGGDGGVVCARVQYCAMVAADLSVALIPCTEQSSAQAGLRLDWESMSQMTSTPSLTKDS